MYIFTKNNLGVMGAPPDTYWRPRRKMKRQGILNSARSNTSIIAKTVVKREGNPSAKHVGLHFF